MSHRAHHFLITLLFIVSSLLSSHVFSQPALVGKEIYSAYQAGEVVPKKVQGATVDMSSAYKIQAAFVTALLQHENSSKQDKISGFKAGLTSHDVQEIFGINRSVFGVLLRSQDHSKNKIISLKNFHQLFIETELGFITAKPIKYIVHSVADLKTYFAKIVPVIELPDIGFLNNPLRAIDLVIGNAGSAVYIIDENVNLLDHDINSMTVSLLKEGQIINQGQGADALGDQWEALRWLVNQVIASGWMIDEGHLFITGALGMDLPARPGKYKALYDGKISLEFTLVS